MGWAGSKLERKQVLGYASLLGISWLERTFSLSTRLGGPRGILLLEVVLNLSGSMWLRSSCRDVSYLGGIEQSGGDVMGGVSFPS